MQHETIADDRMLDERRMIERWSVRIRTPSSCLHVSAKSWQETCNI